MSDFTWLQVHAFRLQRHFLGQPDRPEDLLDVVSGTCGMQAQVMSAAQLALRARSNGVAVSEIERALWQDPRLGEGLEYARYASLAPCQRAPALCSRTEASPLKTRTTLDGAVWPR